METRFHVHFSIEFVFIYVPDNRDKETIEKGEKEVRVTSRIGTVTASSNILRVIEGFSNRYASHFFHRIPRRRILYDTERIESLLLFDISPRRIYFQHLRTLYVILTYSFTVLSAYSINLQPRQHLA